MASAKNERVLNLLICLLGTRQFVTAEKIKAVVPGYDVDRAGSAPSLDAFKRMFERDKAELRELGVEIETGTNGFGDTEPGYRVSDRASKLPSVDLTPAESAAVVLATRLWRSAELESAAQGALLKLKASGVSVDENDSGPFSGQLRTSDPRLEEVMDAVSSRTPLRFDYRGADDDEPRRRHVQPWGAVSWRGRWYVVGHDTDRQARRSFRLSRIVGELSADGRPGGYQPPRDVDLYGAVAFETRPRELPVRIRVHEGAADGLRRMADDKTGDPAGQDVDHELTIRFSDAETAAAIVSRYGDTVEILDPPEARAAIVQRLRRLAAWTDEAVSA